MDECTWYRNVSEGVKTPARQVGGVDRAHNTEREGKEAVVRMSTGRIEQMGVVEVEGEVGDEIAIVGDVLVPRMAIF